LCHFPMRENDPESRQSRRPQRRRRQIANSIHITTCVDDVSPLRALRSPTNRVVQIAPTTVAQSGNCATAHRRLSLPRKDLQQVWQNPEPIPSPHCRLSLPRKDLHRAWQILEPIPSLHCRLSVPRKDHHRAWQIPVRVASPRHMSRNTAQGARPANRKLGVKHGDVSVEVSDRSVGHRIERLWPRSRFSARGPGWPACPQGAERFGKRLHCPGKLASTHRIGGSCPTSKGLLPISSC
jgi:hypothetical protein